MNLPFGLRIKYKQNFNAYCFYWGPFDIVCTRRRLALIANCSMQDLCEMCNELIAFKHRDVDYFESPNDMELLLTMLVMLGGDK